MAEPADAEDDVPAVDERLDCELIVRDVLADVEENAVVLFDASEELVPEFDRLFSWAVPTPLVEEELSVGTTVAVLLEELRPDEGLELLLTVDELCM